VNPMHFNLVAKQWFLRGLSSYHAALMLPAR
jgi:hypothetical protein